MSIVVRRENDQKFHATQTENTGHVMSKQKLQILSYLDKRLLEFIHLSELNLSGDLCYLCVATFVFIDLGEKYAPK